MNVCVWRMKCLDGWFCSGVQLPAYSWFKSIFARKGLNDRHPLAHALSSLGSASMSVMVINPLDVVRTRLFNQPFDAQGKGLWYKNGADAAVKVLRVEGPLAFYKGALTHFMRLGPHLALVFTFHEQIKRKLV